jgi:cell division protein FtsB
MDLRVRHLSKSRIVPKPQDGIRVLVDRAPQAEAFVERMTERFRPWFAWFFAARRRLATAGVCVVTVWVFLHIVFGANGMMMYRQKHTEYQVLVKDLDLLQKENERYTNEIKALKTDPATIEKAAREQLHYARPGEVVYVGPASPQTDIPKNKSAQK